MNGSFPMARFLSGWAGLALVAVLFVAVNIVGFQILRDTRIDLTQDRLYTISPGTRSILASIDEPIELDFYFSSSVARGIPPLEGYAQVVWELLQQYERLAGGQLRLRRVEPEPFSEAEDQAVLEGLQGIPANPQGDMLFFGLVGRNAIDEVETIPFFTPARERFLEYDLSSFVMRLANPKQPAIGVVSTLPILGDDLGFDVLRQRDEIADPWVIMTSLRQLHDVRDLGTRFDAVADDIDMLFIVHPKDLPEQTLRAIDQFALSGRAVVVFVDPFAEEDQPPFDPQNPMARLQARRSSNLEPLFNAWGVAFDADHVVGDRSVAVNVQYQSPRGLVAGDYVAWMSFRGEQIDSDEFILAEIDTLNFLTAGAFEPLDGATTTFMPLVRTTEASMRFPAQQFSFGVDPGSLLRGFEDSGERFVLAARVAGPARTAFPAGGDEERDGWIDGGQVNVLLVGDTDVLSDRLWVQSRQLMGQRLILPFAGNGDFVFNSVEFLFGATDLAQVRSRGRFSRPFERVERLEAAAQERFREREASLQQELEETQRRINELQRDRGGAAALTLSPEQQEQLEILRERVAETRRELRAVQLELRREIDGLGRRLAFINMFAVPALLVLAAFGSWGLRLVRRRRRN